MDQHGILSRSFTLPMTTYILSCGACLFCVTPLIQSSWHVEELTTREINCCHVLRLCIIIVISHISNALQSSGVRNQAINLCEKGLSSLLTAKCGIKKHAPYSAFKRAPCYIPKTLKIAGASFKGKRWANPVLQPVFCSND